MPAAVFFPENHPVETTTPRWRVVALEAEQCAPHRRRYAGEIAAADLGKRTPGAKRTASDSPGWNPQDSALVTTQYAKGLAKPVPDIASMLPDSPPMTK